MYRNHWNDSATANNSTCQTKSASKKKSRGFLPGFETFLVPAAVSTACAAEWRKRLGSRCEIMRFIKIENTDSKEFKEAWSIYESSFPSDERRDLKSQLKSMKNELYNFFVVYEDKILAAIITDWNLGNFLFVEHLAVKENLRGKGIGTKVLNEHLKITNKKTILEVERPANETAAKRIKFYEKIGFKLSGEFDYIQPSYGKGKNPVPMFLMAYPESINDSEFSCLRENIHTKVYGLNEPLLGFQINRRNGY